MAREIKIAVLMICLNEERFLDLSLTRIWDYADQILIAEGATELAVELGWTGPDGRSIDRTAEIIEAWARREDHKLAVVRGNGPWRSKAAMYNALLGLLGREITHIHLVSPDEIYEMRDLETIRGLLEMEPQRTLAIQARHYGPGGVEFHGGADGVLDHFYHRVFPRQEGILFEDRGIDRLGSGLPVREVTEFKIQHYGHIDPEYSARKGQYYQLRAERWRQSK